VNPDFSAYRPHGSLPAEPLAPYSGPWNVRLTAHLLRRAGFGGSPADVAALAAMPVERAVDRFVNFPPGSDAGAPPDVPDESGVDAQLASAVAAMNSADIVELRKEQRALRRRGVIAAQLWWLDRMLATPAPLQEKMTLFWHGHFTTAAIAKGVTPAEALAQNVLFRQYALGNIRDLTLKVSTDPAMLKYLDNIRNSKSSPNENYARELMELFTLGIGNYTENDVREAARAWTGLRLQRGSESVAVVPRLHDDGSKTFLGRTGSFAGTDIVDIIFTQPAAATFFATELLNFFVYNDPEPELVGALAATIRKYDFNLRPVLSALLRSQVFFSDRAYRALVKSPVEYVIGSYKLFGIGQATPEALAALGRMGQILFYPPNVKGWPGGSYWLNTETVLARENFANSLMTSQTIMGGASWLLQGGPGDLQAATRVLIGTILQGDASPDATAKLAGFLRGDGTAALAALSGENFDQRMRGGAYLTMAMPAYQLA
jgi:uncharacterized protein (DUF1800 family)